MPEEQSNKSSNFSIGLIIGMIIAAVMATIIYKGNKPEKSLKKPKPSKLRPSKPKMFVKPKK